MIKSPPEFRALTSELSVSTWTLSTMGVLFESGLADVLKEWRSVEELATRCPALSTTRIERCLALAASVGAVVMEGSRYRLAEGALPFLAPPMRASLQGDVRSTLMQALAMLDAAAAGQVERAWRHTNPALLQAQGDASAAMPGIFKSNLLPSMGDLAARLERPGARLLDVGVGVGSLAIAMCRAFPQLHVVGVDSFDVPLAMARANVTRAGLEDRIALRLGTIEDLGDAGSFDLAWLPTFFIDEAVLPAATARVHAALHPGGWILFPTGCNPAATERQGAYFALVTDFWGGPALSIERAESMLKDAGFQSIRPLPGPGWAPAMVVAQRGL